MIKLANTDKKTQDPIGLSPCQIQREANFAAPLWEKITNFYRQNSEYFASNLNKWK